MWVAKFKKDNGASRNDVKLSAANGSGAAAEPWAPDDKTDMSTLGLFGASLSGSVRRIKLINRQFRSLAFSLASVSVLVLMAFKLASALAQPSDERDVLATDDRRVDALRRGDPAPLREIYADDYTLVTPAGVVRSKAEQISELETGELRYRSIEVLERSVRMYSDVAVVMSRDKYDILLRGQQPGGDIRFTRVYKKFGSKWRVIATHGSRIGQ